MILGIDLGSTTTKIVLMDGLKILQTSRIDRQDAYDAFLTGIDLSKVTKIMVTGAGAAGVSENILGIPTEHVEEFRAAALGGYFLSGLERCMVVSLGTGTSFVYVERDKREHAGGTGIGGALLKTLAGIGLGMTDVGAFLELGNRGTIQNADLLISDISPIPIDNLYGDVTAANMAKLNQESTPEDYAFGVCNLIFQNVAVMAVMADRPYKTGKVVVMGSIGQTPVARRCFELVGKLFGYEFIIPENALYGVAVGAILQGNDDYINSFSVYGMEDDVDYIFE